MSILDEKYDVIVLENGLAGQACAIRCAELGLKTLCISSKYSGFTNKAKYPTHIENMSVIALLESAKHYEAIVHTINNHGIYAEDVTVNFDEMVARKNAVLAELNDKLLLTFDKLKINHIQSDAQLITSGLVKLSAYGNQENLIVKADHIVLATDSVSVDLSFAPIDNQFILDACAALNFNSLPKHIAILGAGIIGLQIAGIYNRLGANVVILEAQESFLNVTDYQISTLAFQIFEAQGIELRLGTRVISTQIIANKVVVEYQDMDGHHAIKVDKLIVASGRRPNSENLAAPEADLLLDEDGFVLTNEQYRTNLPGVYAIGDLTMHGPMLSHKGIAEGNLLAERIAGITAYTINYRTIPNIIYTEPEIAWVGQTEQALKALGESIKTATTLLENNFRAKAFDKTTGIIKIITHAQSDEILGVHVLSPHASEIIAEAALAIEFKASSEDLTRAIHSHPSFNEAFYEVSYSLQ